MSRSQAYYLQHLGITEWVSRAPLSDSLTVLAEKVATCTQCGLCKTRTNTVFAKGSPNADLMIIGEAPGFYEDKAGLPFVGKAGHLLNKMLAAIGLTEEAVYIANVLKCRPPDNRDPRVDEVMACTSYLKQQIAIVRPKLLLAVGRFAGQFLLGNTMPLKQMREQVHTYEGISALISYHPAYLLRNPKDKKHAYKDFLRAKSMLVE